MNERPADSATLFSELCQPRCANPNRLDHLRRIAAREDLTEAQRELCLGQLSWLPEEQAGAIRRLLMATTEDLKDDKD